MISISGFKTDGEGPGQGITGRNTGEVCYRVCRSFREMQVLEVPQPIGIAFLSMPICGSPWVTVEKISYGISQLFSWQVIAGVAYVLDVAFYITVKVVQEYYMYL